jgi:hypothetical protein
LVIFDKGWELECVKILLQCLFQVFLFHVYLLSPLPGIL